MHCPICGTELNRAQEKCPKCGTKLDWSDYDEAMQSEATDNYSEESNNNNLNSDNSNAQDYDADEDADEYEMDYSNPEPEVRENYRNSQAVSNSQNTNAYDMNDYYDDEDEESNIGKYVLIGSIALVLIIIIGILIFLLIRRNGNKRDADSQKTSIESFQGSNTTTTSTSEEETSSSSAEKESKSTSDKNSVVYVSTSTTTTTEPTTTTTTTQEETTTTTKETTTTTTTTEQTTTEEPTEETTTTTTTKATETEDNNSDNQEQNDQGNKKGDSQIRLPQDPDTSEPLPTGKEGFDKINSDKLPVEPKPTKNDDSEDENNDQKDDEGKEDENKDKDDNNKDDKDKIEKLPSDNKTYNDINKFIKAMLQNISSIRYMGAQVQEDIRNLPNFVDVEQVPDYIWVETYINRFLEDVKGSADPFETPEFTLGEIETYLRNNINPNIALDPEESYEIPPYEYVVEDKVGTFSIPETAVEPNELIEEERESQTSFIPMEVTKLNDQNYEVKMLELNYDLREFEDIKFRTITDSRHQKVIGLAIDESDAIVSDKEKLVNNGDYVFFLTEEEMNKNLNYVKYVIDKEDDKFILKSKITYAPNDSNDEVLERLERIENNIFNNLNADSVQTASTDIPLMSLPDFSELGDDVQLPEEVTKQESSKIGTIRESDEYLVFNIGFDDQYVALSQDGDGYVIGFIKANELED